MVARPREENPEPDPTLRRWLPPSPWRPPLPDIHAEDWQEHWRCEIPGCHARGCPVPPYDNIQAGLAHLLTHVNQDPGPPTEKERAAMASVPEPSAPEPAQPPLQPVPDSAASGDPLAAAEALNEGIRQLSDILLGAVRTLEAEGWTPTQARALVLKTYLGVVPE